MNADTKPDVSSDFQAIFYVTFHMFFDETNAIQSQHETFYDFCEIFAKSLLYTAMISIYSYYKSYLPKFDKILKSLLHSMYIIFGKFFVQYFFVRQTLSRERFFILFWSDFKNCIRNLMENISVYNKPYMQSLLQ